MDNIRHRIACQVRELRQARRWTQKELAKRLGLSQSRLSEIERGAGSFTAEQFLVMLRLFNVPATDFAAPTGVDQTAELQNALARLGAKHLHESDQVQPSERLANVHLAVGEALADGSPRVVTALAPVLVTNADTINLRRLAFELTESGLERRLAWLVESTLEAIGFELAAAPPHDWTRRYRRAVVVLEAYAESARARRLSEGALPSDILDPGIRSKRSVTEVRLASSDSAKRWGIITSIKTSDFERALRGARASD